MNLWDYYSDIQDFENIAAERQEEILKVMLGDEAIKRWNYPTMLTMLLDHVDSDTVLSLVDHYLTSESAYYDSDASFGVVQKAYNRCNRKNEIKDLVRKCKSKTVHRSLLMMDNTTISDEELGLRSLSGIKYAPDILYTEKYTPSIDAIKNLPPVTRLKALETLLRNNDLAYNIFKNFNDSDEFKSLLFGAVLRHRDRVEQVWEKFNEVKDLGKDATVMITYSCPNCGECNISIQSTRVRTQTGLDTTRIGRFLNYRHCPLCGKWGDDIKKEFECINKEE